MCPQCPEAGYATGRILNRVYEEEAGVCFCTLGIEVVELESKLHSQQCFLNLHKYSEIISCLILFLMLLCKVYQTKSGSSLAILCKQAPIVITHKLNKQISTDTTSIQINYYPLRCNPRSFMSSSFTKSSSVLFILKQTKKQRSTRVYTGLHLVTLFMDDDWLVGEVPCSSYWS